MKKNIFLSILSGLLLALPFSFGRLWILAWFGFLPLFYALRNASKIRAFLLSYLCGFVFWWLTIYWLVHVTFIGTFVLILYLSLYFGLFGLFFFYFTHYTFPAKRDPARLFLILVREHITQILSLSSTWVLLEYTRSHLLTGFPWALLGYSQYLNLPLIQIADITGAWGVSFVLMAANLAVYSGFGGGQGTGYRVQGTGAGKKQNLVIPVLMIVVVLIYGYYKLYLPPSTFHLRPIRISVVQGNIPQELKWLERAKGFITQKYLKLTALAAQEKPDLIIWPEASLPVIPEQEPIYYEYLNANIKLKQVPLLLGAVTARENNYYNSALLISGIGELLERYDKLHLVPFGEYIPLKDSLPFLRVIVPIGDISAGKEYTVFRVPATKALAGRQGSGGRVEEKFSVLICFEDLFPELSRRFVREGADFLVNITNDAWYKKTSAAMQHFQASVFRAVENRVFLVRAANTGISGFIAPSGKIISLVRDDSGSDTFVDGYKTESIDLQRQLPAFYTKFGDKFIFACLLFILCGIILSRKNK
ncbi:MAG: apolipoprotein N-acyltransferase [Candidatus Omnitrophota bacterium]